MRCLMPNFGVSIRGMFIGKLIWAFLWSGIKYLIGVASCLALFSNPLWGFVITTLGAMFGSIVFTFGGIWIETWFRKRFLSKKSHFNKRTRLLVKLKRNGGLPLVALLTPVFLSIPIGCIMATAFVHQRWKIVGYVTISAAFWGVLIFGGQWIFGVDIASWLRGN